MAGLKLFTALLLLISSLAIGGKRVEAQVHHVVGGDSGWHPSSDIGSWAAGRNFRVGDHLWFGYVAAEDSVLELQTMEEYLSCDLANPIRMLTEGVNKISLEEEGIRLFASGNRENCKNGLKLQLNVRNETMAAATGPTPSTSAHLNGFPYALFVGFLLLSMGF